MASDTRTREHDSLTRKTTGIVSSASKETRPLRQFFTKFNNDWAMTFSGALAYSLLTAMLPIAIAIVAIVGLVIPGETVLNALHGIPGLSGAQQDLFVSVTKRLNASAGFLVVIAVVLAIFGGSRLFIAIEGSMDIIYRVRPRTFFWQNLIAIGMMIVFAILTPIMIFASTLPSLVLNIIANNPALKTIPFLSTLASNGFMVQIAGYAGGLIAAFLLFEAIYMVVPNQKINLRNSWQGAIVAAVLLEAFIILFPVYTSRFMNSYTGQIGFAIVLLAFFYYFAVILLLGAEVNAYFFEGVQPLPNNLATFVSTMGARLNKDRPEAESSHHINPQPTEKADDRHIEDAVENDNDTANHGNTTADTAQHGNSRSQQKPVAQPASYQPVGKKKRLATTKPGKVSTAISIVAGSALTVLIETLRLRRGK
ncbi:YihY/virulence factor BrkB family protein [Dictyobacter arantiisoli]|uniref:YihY/virulence factor BrkB family protein n=1 Tax=Dictyobacter arantiisoli TaxID=2014874 RepID=A0A5A5TJ10_9CHLR|nr:YihY/virulence factor BrkB family protein [Dictyobacter arantiisoli]GCF10989.1 hypothetical protein KDI_45530 [Dictyobacter arantiisoli]